MPFSKKFLEAISKDEALRAELEREILEALITYLREKGIELEAGQVTGEALAELLKERGLEEEATKIAESVIERFSKAHGFEDEQDVQDEELVLDELDAVAGGSMQVPPCGRRYGKRQAVRLRFLRNGKV